MKTTRFIVLLFLLLVGCTSINEEVFPTIDSSHETTSISVFTQEATSITTETINPTHVQTATISGEGLVPEKYKHLIGLTYPPLPEGMEGSGSIIYPAGKPMWSVALGHINDETVVWLSKMVQDGNSPTWRITDILVLPRVQQKNAVFLSDGCMEEGKYNPEIIAIVIEGEDAFNSRYVDSSKILYAWLMDRSAQVFKVIEVSSKLSCQTDQAIRISN